jgi:hypothetical protein
MSKLYFSDYIRIMRMFIMLKPFWMIKQYINFCSYANTVLNAQSKRRK